MVDWVQSLLYRFVGFAIATAVIFFNDFGMLITFLMSMLIFWIVILMHLYDSFRVTNTQKWVFVHFRITMFMFWGTATTFISSSTFIIYRINYLFWSIYLSKRKLVRISMMYTCGWGPNMTGQYFVLKNAFIPKVIWPREHLSSNMSF